MKRSRTVVKWIGKILCLLGCAWFLLPLLHGGFDLGAVFGLCVCLLGFLILHFYRRLAERGGWQKAIVRLVSAFYCLGLLWAGYLTGLMISAQYRTPPAGTNVIVLGAQVYSAERMGVTLTNRVDRAVGYLLENPGASCIVTGGQGGDEPCPEALTEKNALLRLGIEEERIYMEDQSRNTRQNLNFSREIAEREGLGTEFALVTQGFHMYRALNLAESAGLTPYSLVADTDPILLPEYYGRELLSLTKWHAEKLLLE
ncbi:YdcF family protein [Neglectibacter caecimuris]|uniref:YdcF family protein n=1 Tax=Neglectibacter caecimuris TaxID=3093658 RepID=UPI002AC8BEBA|nr:YdcF family protein [Neglectibacter sp. M00184]